MGIDSPHVESDLGMAQELLDTMVSAGLDLGNLHANLTAHFIYDLVDGLQTINSLEMHLVNYLTEISKQFDGEWHGHTQIPDDRHVSYSLHGRRIDRVYFDFLNNLAGFTLLDPSSNERTEVGSRYDQTYLDLGPYLGML